MPSRPLRSLALRSLALLVIGALTGTSALAVIPAIVAAVEPPDHLVISEVVTGGASASDEFIELYNPTAGPLPLEGLEVIYISSSGLTVTRRAAWAAGAPDVLSGGHLLVANELGSYASIADALYASGMAATGGSVALRIQGASLAIDAAGWGSAASTWLEGTGAAAPPPGASIERLPGGALGSTQDTDDNATDFIVRDVPEPENSTSPLVPDPSPGSPQPTPSPTPVPTVAPTAPGSPTPTPTAMPSQTVTPSPSADDPVLSIATARALPDGSRVTIEGVALTSSDFTDGGGYLADATGGVAVLLTDATFGRGEWLRVSGELDDRYAQRTVRAAGTDVMRLGNGSDPHPVDTSTGAVGEALEGRLVRISGTVVGSPTVLSAGLAFDVDDGSGAVRLLLGPATGIDSDDWAAGAVVTAVGVAGQRDSSGTGLAGFRVLPRDAADIASVIVDPGPSGTPGPTASADPTSDPTQTPIPGEGVIGIAAARQLPKRAAVRVQGVVTLAPGTVDPVTAVIQDESGAIVLRVGDETGSLVRGTRVEIDGTRSTLAGMETLRVVGAARSLGSASEPAGRRLRTGDATEAHEAALVMVRGGLVASPRRSSGGTTSFEIDDGSGPLRVSISSATGISGSGLVAGAWIEIRGVLGQETTGSLPLRGYRVWPRDASDLQLTATPPAQNGSTTEPGEGVGGADDPGAALATAGLEALGGAAIAGLTVGATLVSGPWEELGVGGLLWDGARLVALDTESGPLVSGVLGADSPPLALALTGLRSVGREPETGVALIAVSNEPGSIEPLAVAPVPPLGSPDQSDRGARWVTLVGRLSERGSSLAVANGRRPLAIDLRCDGERPRQGREVGVTGILVGDPPRIIVPCGGIAPAPVLLRVAADPATAHVAPPDASARISDEPDSPANGFAAVLLLIAALMLAGGAAGARLTGRTEHAADQTADLGSESREEPAVPPTLTLVPMPRERAP